MFTISHDQSLILCSCFNNYFIGIDTYGVHSYVDQQILLQNPKHSASTETDLSYHFIFSNTDHL